MTDTPVQTFPVQEDNEDSQSSISVNEREKSTPFCCNICNQKYTRVDHLSRHYRSHTREKPYSCSTCGKNFARTDLLKRHALNHAHGRKDSKSQYSTTQLTRVAQACAACASAKLKCGNDKPCHRCQQKGIICSPPLAYGNDGTAPSRARVSESESNDSQPQILPDSDMDMTASQNEGHQYLEPHHQPTPTQISRSNGFLPTPASISILDPADFPVDSGISTSSLPSNDDTMLDIDDDSNLAEFLRDIMAHGSPNTSENSVPIDFNPQTYSSWDVFNFGMESSLEFNDMDLGWISSQNNQASAMNRSMVFDNIDPALDRGQKTPDVQISINLGAEAFSKSLWNWLPGQCEHGWMELGNLSLPYKDIEGLENRSTPDLLDNRLEQSSRDAILAMVLSTSGQESGIARAITSFPSAQLLNSFIHLFFRSEVSKADSWIHLPTFHPRTQRPELNGILVAAGAILSTVPTVRKLGYAIHETVRIGLPNLFERDNSRTRELQLLQTYALELQIGLWSGNKRKMEIAESHAQPLITMLRRAGRYRRSRAPPAAPDPEDDDKVLDTKWREWIKAESYKRLAFHILIHDAQASISLLVRPLISYAEVSLELPCAPSMWRAKTAQAWRAAYLQHNGNFNRLPSLMNCIHDLSPLSKFQGVIDVQYSSTIILHAIWSLIAEYRQLEFVLKLQSQERHWNGGLISSSWHQELGHLLEHFRVTVNECPDGVRLEQTMTQELFMMNLHVSFEELQLFAGKEGNEEAQRVYPLLKLWFENRKSRQAVWHAGQVIRAAAAFPPNELRDFHAVALYHASLAFWVYGMVSLGSSRSRARKNHGVDPNSVGESEFIYLDGEEMPEVRRFIAISRGVPVIHELPIPPHPSTGNGGEQPAQQNNAAPGYARLDNPKAIMEVVIGILCRNCSGGNSGLAPLIENLAQLVRDLGNAGRIVGQ